MVKCWVDVVSGTHFGAALDPLWSMSASMWVFQQLVFVWTGFRFCLSFKFKVRIGNFRHVWELFPSTSLFKFGGHGIGNIKHVWELFPRTSLFKFGGHGFAWIKLSGTCSRKAYVSERWSHI